MAKSLEEYPRQVQAGILAGIVVLMGAVVAWYFVWPRAQKCFGERSAIQTQRAQNAASRSFELQRALYQKRLQDAEARLEDLRSKVPDDADPAGLVRLVHDAESASGVHVRSLIVQPPVTADAYVELPAKLHVDGEYDALVRFFDQLGGSARVTNVSDLGLRAATTAGPGAFTLAPRETVAADFVLSTYCNRTAATPAAAAAPTSVKK